MPGQEQIRDMNGAEIRAFVEDYRSLLEGSKIRKIQEAVTGGIFLYTSREDVYIHIEAGLTHIATGHKLDALPRPSAFVMYLRKRISGAVIKKMIMPREGDRILRLELSTGDALILELTGRHGNILLLDPSDVIRITWRRSSSTTRLLKPGEHYVLPPQSPMKTERAVFTGPEVFTLYQKAILRARAMERMRSRRRELTRRIRRIRRSMAAVHEDRKRFEQDLSMKRMGDLFLTTAHQWAPGQRSMMVDPAPDGKTPLLLQLPPGARTPYDGAQWAYGRASRAKRGLKRTEQRIRELKQELAHLQEELDSLTLNDFTDIVTHDASRREPGRQSLGSRAAKKKKSAVRIPGRHFVSADGISIYVGRNAQENHELTFRHAKGSHHWFHARDYTGSHVLVMHGGDLPSETLLDAATLAIHYSDAKTEGEVVYTLRKYLTPVKGSVGMARMSRFRTIYMVKDPARIKRLMESGPDSRTRR